MSARLPRSLVAAALAAVALMTGCSGHSSGAGPAPAKTPTRAPVVNNAYDQAVVAAHASALWSLRDGNALLPGAAISDLAGNKHAATVVGGTIVGTKGLGGQPALQFDRSGRIVTPVTSGLAGSDAFTVELNLRPDACVSAWGRVLGTTKLVDKSGREGFEFLHFPQQFLQNPCRFGVEFWHNAAYLGGCHPKAVPVLGVWVHWAVTYARGTVSCYENGALVETGRLSSTDFTQPGPLGIGGSGSGFQGPADGISVGEVTLYTRALSVPEIRSHALLALRPAPTASPTP